MLHGCSAGAGHNLRGRQLLAVALGPGRYAAQPQAACRCAAAQPCSNTGQRTAVSYSPFAWVEAKLYECYGARPWLKCGEHHEKGQCKRPVHVVLTGVAQAATLPAPGLLLEGETKNG